MADEKPKPRGMMAIKSQRLDVEWQNLVRKAAKMTGTGVGDFIVEACRERAQAVVKSGREREPEEGIPAGIPARPEDVADRLAELMTAEFARRDGEQAARMEALAAQLRREQAAALAEVQRNARLGRWR